MPKRAEDYLKDLREIIAREPGENELVPLIDAGRASRDVLGALAAEQYRIIASDWRAFLSLAAESTGLARVFFTSLATGEQIATPKLIDYAAACGLSLDDLERYRPLAGCQAYPSFIAWLVLNADPRDALLAIIANFVEFGAYCRAIARALRERYGFDDTGTAFFDFFAEPNPDLDQLGLDAIQEALDTGWRPTSATSHGLLLHSYELLFWNTLADTEKCRRD